MGEQRPNSDAKVFEVIVEIEGTDATLRPSMTTSNKIIASVKDKMVFIPLECLQSEYDSITYVFKKDGASIEKQEVIVGETNSNDASILGGIAEGDKIYLSMPSGQEGRSTKLLPEMNGKRKKKDGDEKAVAGTLLPEEKKWVAISSTKKPNE